MSFEFKGYRFERTDEVRSIKKGEWYWCAVCKEPECAVMDYESVYEVLREIKAEVSAPPQPPAPLNSLSTGFSVKIIFHTNEAHDKIKSETFVREKIGAIFDTYGVQEEIDYTLEVRRLYE